jgi:hypothetical protein
MTGINYAVTGKFSDPPVIMTCHFISGLSSITSRFISRPELRQREKFKFACAYSGIRTHDPQPYTLSVASIRHKKIQIPVVPVSYREKIKVSRSEIFFF